MDLCEFEFDKLKLITTDGMIVLIKAKTDRLHYKNIQKKNGVEIYCEKFLSFTKLKNALIIHKHKSMKKLLFIFVLALLTSGLQGQSLAEKEITGTWFVKDVVELGTKPKKAKEMTSAYIDIYPDYSFQLRLKTAKGYENNFTNATWSYNETTQTITTSDDRFPIKILKANNKMIFELSGTGIQLEVVKPI